MTHKFKFVGGMDGSKFDFRRRIVATLIACAAMANATSLLAVEVSLDGTAVFRDGFEGGTVGQQLQPFAPLGKWSVAINGFTSTLQYAGAGGPGPGAAAVGDQYLSFFRATEPPGSDVIADGLFTTPASTGTIHAEWWMYIPELDNKDYGVLIGPSDANRFGNGTTIPGFTRMAVFSVNGANPRVVYRRQVGENTQWDLADITYAYDTWQRWQVDWTLGSGQVTLTIGEVGSEVSQVLNVPDSGTLPLDRFIVQGSNFPYSYYIDGNPLDDTIPAWTPGDFDIDGDVDGADFVIWQTNFPRASNGRISRGDADFDRDVDGADFVAWQTNFPFTPGPSASPVPEPGAWILASLGSLIGFRALRRKQG